MEFTKIIRGRDHFNGCSNRCGHSFSAKPCSYGCPATPRNRSANVSAQQCAQPGETSSQPVTGFQVASVHSIALLSAKVVTRSDL